MTWVWINIFFIWSVLTFAGYTFTKLIDRHFELDEKVDDKYLALVRRIEELEKAEGQNSISIDTLVDDLEYLDKCVKEDTERAGLAFANMENRISRLGLRIEGIKEGYSNGNNQKAS